MSSSLPDAAVGMSYEVTAGLVSLYGNRLQPQRLPEGGNITHRPVK